METESVKPKMNFEGADKDLKEVKEVYDKFGVKFWLFGGTLLGAIREKNYISGDDDMDCGMYFEDNNKIVNILEELTRRRGFKCMVGSHMQTGVKSYKYFSFKIIRNQLIDMLCFIKIGDKRVYMHGGMPNEMVAVWWNDSKFFDKLDVVNFRGTKYYIPSSVEEGLSLWYGNWKVPGGGAFWSYEIKMEQMPKEQFFNLIR
jgi:hypothetical protein